MRVGASYTFKTIEMYLPNNDETHDRASKDLAEHQEDQTGLAPEFAANVKAEVDFNVRVSPEIQMGIKVGGGIGPLKASSNFLNSSVSTSLGLRKRQNRNILSGCWQSNLTFFLREHY
jgi:hypothetical protein